LGITSCNVLASKENIKSNTGFYLLLFILAIFIIIFIIFCSRGYNSLESKIDEVIYKKFKKTETIKNNILKKPIKQINKKSKMQNKNNNIINVISRPNNTKNMFLNKRHSGNKNSKKNSNLFQQKGKGIIESKLASKKKIKL